MNIVPERSLLANPSNGGRFIPTQGRSLPLEKASLTADASGGVARVVLEQHFHNPHAEPLAVTYSLPLPADAAVSGFAFRVGDRLVVGEVDLRNMARQRYEQALVEGRSAALLEQDRSSVFTQEIGNVPPGETVVVEVTIDQRLRWLDEGSWEWRFPTTVAPRYLGEAGRVPDAARVTQDIADGPVSARMTMSCRIRDTLPLGARAESSSHPVDVLVQNEGVRVSLRDKNGVQLDRDVVVRWSVVTPKIGLSLDTGRPRIEQRHSDAAYGLLTVVPPSIDANVAPVQRDLIVLIDTSGSMAGKPLDQARRVTAALVDSLRDNDQLELIEFSSASRRWKHGAVAATAAARADALRWLAGLSASGSTEMRAAILEALRTMRPEAQRQVVLVTDGQIGFETEVVAAVSTGLPASSRLHTVGVGSAVNRSLLGPAARAGHGIEVILSLGEDPERAAARLMARTRAPVVVDLELSGSALLEHAPACMPDLFAGAPALIGVKLRPEGGDLTLRGRTAHGSWERRVMVQAIEPGTGSQAAVALFGREAVEDLETALAGGARSAKKAEIDATVERIGVDFQIATRLTSWIAVSAERTVDPSDGLRRERMPHELAYGLSAEGLGLRQALSAGTRQGLGMMPKSSANDEADVLFSLNALMAPEASRLVEMEEVQKNWTASQARMEPQESKAAKPKVNLKDRLGKANIGTKSLGVPVERQTDSFSMPRPMPGYAAPREDAVARQTDSSSMLSQRAPTVVQESSKAEMSVERGSRRKAIVRRFLLALLLVAIVAFLYWLLGQGR